MQLPSAVTWEGEITLTEKSHSFNLFLKLDSVKSAKSENGCFAATNPICQLETAPGLAGCGTAC